MPNSIRESQWLSILCLAFVLVFTLVFATACAEDDSASRSANSTSAAAASKDAASRAADAKGSSSTALASAHSSTHPSTHPSTADSKGSRKPPAEKAARNPNERPIPAFEGTTLAGTRLSVRDMLGQRILFYFFNPELDQATPISKAVGTIAAEAAANNFQVVGVGVGSDASTLTRFSKKLDLKFPIIDDSSGKITKIFRLRSPMAALAVDADGYMTFGLGAFPTDGDIEGTVEKDLRERLRLSSEDTALDGALFAYPDAPELGVLAMSTGEQLKTADLRGRAAVVIFFLHTCPHCHKALESIKKTLAGMKEETKPRLVAISIQNQPSAVRNALKELGLDYFDPYLDPGEKATDRWGVTGGVPVVIVLDPEGRIRHRSSGWVGKRDGAILRMKLAQAAGATVPMILDPKGYSGSEVCGTCHETEFATWQYTSHATAYDTLVTHGADRRTDCVGCHVVGFEEPGGFNFLRQPEHLEDVGCESCHGRGGPHLSPNFVPANTTESTTAEKDYEQVCATCHNSTHSLGFEYATFHERVSHKGIAALSNADRAKLMEGGPARDLLPSLADYVGSNACQSCHQAEFKVWEASPHGHAVETLVKEGKAGEAECLQCHTTAYGKTGGFPESAAFGDQPDLARVGCESCHGAGGDHIGENAKRVGTIISLGDKCDSCVILKICGSCHDDANDPGFQFKVEERIEAQRHGTTESAITRGEADSALRHDPSVAHPVSDQALLRHAFEHLNEDAS